MKALTLWQPWASLITLGHKRVETRCWATKYRGLLAIHSALKKPDFLGKSAETAPFRNLLRNLRIDPGRLPLGEVLCLVRLIHICPVEQCRDDLSVQERIFGNYEDGRYAWFCQLEKVFDPPLIAKGNRLLWEWNGPGFGQMRS